MKKGLKLYVCFIVAIIWSNSYAFAAEKVYFYHTDPAGTPLAMTDTSGNVVWRAVYKPFGEEYSVTQTPGNDMMFVGKEKDKETGLYYFGARYMNDKIGRFVSFDPIGPVDPRTSKTNYEMLTNPQMFNVYAYSLNNPYRYLDSNGKWPTKIHNKIIRAAFPEDKYKDIRSIFEAASEYVDKDQSLESSYKHAMSSPYYDKEHAEIYMYNFTRKKVNEYKTLMSQGKTEQAYFALGEAMHPLMDATSPSHEGFQEWDGIFPLLESGIHRLKELSISGERLQRTADLLRNFYENNE